MSLFRFQGMVVDDCLDKDGDLEIEAEDEYFYFLPREEVVRLRDHLNEVLGQE